MGEIEESGPKLMCRLLKEKAEKHPFRVRWRRINAIQPQKLENPHGILAHCISVSRCDYAAKMRRMFAAHLPCCLHLCMLRPTLRCAPNPCWRSNTVTTNIIYGEYVFPISLGRRWCDGVSVHFMCFDLICEKLVWRALVCAAVSIQKYCIFACVSGIWVSIKRWIFLVPASLHFGCY